MYTLPSQSLKVTRHSQEKYIYLDLKQKFYLQLKVYSKNITYTNNTPQNTLFGT